MIELNSSYCYSTYDVDISLISLDPFLSVISPSQSSSSPQSSTYSSTDSKLMVKRRLVGSKKSFDGRKTANARERARMKVLSKAFSRLKSSLPWVPNDTKLSKLDTLRLALRYINYLALLLKDGQDKTFTSNGESNCFTFTNWSTIQQHESYQYQINSESTTIEHTDLQELSTSCPSTSPNNIDQDLESAIADKLDSNNKIS
uniref:BHLH domain-containing protein n=1 Tax=Tetranychus urticae TaxID=32264 RepID=T1KK29_TETUR